MAESSAGGSDGARPRLTWDEETIAEHDKDRGTRMKIDEPDTPYEPPYDFHSEQEDGSLGDAADGVADTAASAHTGGGAGGEAVGLGGDGVACVDLMAQLGSKLSDVQKTREGAGAATDDAVAKDGIVAQRDHEHKHGFTSKRTAHYGNQRAVMEEAKRLIEQELRGGGDDDDDEDE
eukprot:g4778.t1